MRALAALSRRFLRRPFPVAKPDVRSPELKAPVSPEVLERTSFQDACVLFNHVARFSISTHFVILENPYCLCLKPLYVAFPPCLYLPSPESWFFLGVLPDSSSYIIKS